MDITARAPTITGRQVPLRLIGLVALVVLALAVWAEPFSSPRNGVCRPRSARRPTG